jgi:3',5'-nucleoside bisphosphate phosphatase
VVDLHLHTTISDGRLSPSALVTRAAEVGLRVMSVTDHDTTAGTAEVRTLARAHGIEAVNGIEVTAVERGRDVHILGYFVDDTDAAFGAFLAEQRSRRVDRVRTIAERLAALGVPVDAEALVGGVSLRDGRSIGRPQVAQALVRKGYVSTIAEAFDNWLGEGRPAFVVREGPSCEDVIAAIAQAGGVSSLAHPARTAIDARIPQLCEAGLGALEVYHSDHDDAAVRRYRHLAGELGVLVTGGSDFHGDPQQTRAPGSVVLPDADWVRLAAAAPSHG